MECLSRSESFRIAVGIHPFANIPEFEQNAPESEFCLFAALSTDRCADHDLRRLDQSSSCTKGLTDFFLVAPSSRPNITKSCTRPALHEVSGLRIHDRNAEQDLRDSHKAAMQCEFVSWVCVVTWLGAQAFLRPAHAEDEGCHKIDRVSCNMLHPTCALNIALSMIALWT